MGLADRDYMHERHRNTPKKGPWNKGKLLVQPVPFSFLKKALVFAMAVMLVTLLFHRFSQNGNSFSWQSLLRPATPALPLPATGNVTLYQLGHSLPAVASFQVKAKSSRADVHHLVKLVEVGSGQSVLSVFVRSGETASLKVPLGTYKVHIATGERWYGETKLFGKEMAVTQGKATLDFSADQNVITAHTLTLDDVVNGNYPTRPIEADAF